MLAIMKLLHPRNQNEKNNEIGYYIINIMTNFVLERGLNS